MDSSDRPHRTSSSSTSTASDLFICFTSRLSSSSSNPSSSMKISSKSILSPGRSRDPPVSLSTSLSRRLRTNGSLKGGQSPMFPTGGGKKRGCGFDNPEPSSPKVTCIGQVRVKTKKQGKKMRTLSRRRSGGGEVSFRRIDSSREGANPNQNLSFHPPPPPQECLPHRNQRWVHLPLTICEALRAFGAEFSCLFPCRSSCFSTSDREKEDKPNSSDSSQRSCGAVFARWLVAMQEGEGGAGGRGREIELVVGGEEERTGFRERTFRRHVGDDIEMFQDEKFMEADEGRASICVPPKNALLLMRCRSDPTRVSALASRFAESISPHIEEDEEDIRSEEDNFQEVHEELGAAEPIGYSNLAVEPELPENLVSSVANVEAEQEQNPEEKDTEQHFLVEMEEEDLEAEKVGVLQILEEAEQEPAAVVEEIDAGKSVSDSVLADQEQSMKSEEEDGLLFTESLEDEELAMMLMLINEIEDEEGERRTSNLSCSIESSSHSNPDSEGEEEPLLSSLEEHGKTEEEESQETEETSTKVKLTQEVTLKEEDEKLTQEQEKSDSEEPERPGIAEEGSEKKKKPEIERASSGSVLPDCLLLMMCEPKLSMEVSKETWVCSTDFIRFLPERPARNVKASAGDGRKKRVGVKPGPPPLPTQRATKQKPPPHIQPGRSSCSLPVTAAKSMATMIEQKLVNAVAYEPFVLTRCKSEPMRTAAAKLAPESCFWNNRKLEPHRESTFGVGAAGVGF